MEVSFYSIDNEKNEISFKTEGHYEEEFLVFEDTVVSNTLIFLKAKDDEIELLRKGKIDMSLVLMKERDGYLKYKDDQVYFELEAKTNEISVKTDEIYFNYDLIDDNYTVGSHKIWIKLH